MRKGALQLWLFVALALVAVALGGCMHFDGDIPEPVSGEVALATLDGAQSQVDEATAKGEEDVEAFAAVVAWLSSRPEVRSAAVSSDPTIVEFVFQDGTPGLFLGGEAWSESATENTAIALGQMPFLATSSQPGRKTALILDPFPIFFDRSPSRVKAMLEGIEYPVTYLRGEEATLAALRGIHEHGVIMISTHGGLHSGQVVLLTGERATADNWQAYTTWRTTGRIGLAGHSGAFWPWESNSKWWFVKPSFFEDVPPSESSLFYAYACHSMEGTTMADALLDTGVAVYAGWTRAAYPAFESNVPQQFFQALCNCMTVAEADVADGSGAATYIGDGELVLIAPSSSLQDDLYSFGRNTGATGAGATAGGGQLGLGDTIARYSPARVSSLQDVTAVAAGHWYSLALVANGDVWSFGRNTWGSLGLGDRVDRYTPTRITGLSNVVAISAGYDHNFAILTNGDIYAFGANNAGQLGLGNTVHPRTSPQKVTTICNVVAIAAGAWHSLFLTTSGDVYSCGWGAYGALGHGDKSNQSSPKRIAALSNVSMVAAGDQHSLVLLKNGDVYAFGLNNYGQLGLGDSSDRFVPTKITSLSKVVAVECGYYHSLVLLENGDVYSFGYNNRGQLGHGDKTDRDTPTRIAGVPHATTLAAGSHSLVIVGSGDVYSFGGNQYGELGHGDIVDRLVPTRITALSRVVGSSVGGGHTLVIVGD